MGPDYAHAEARKSPALDGKVERDQNGKEIRYPVILSAKEKLIARKVCLGFKVSVYKHTLLYNSEVCVKIMCFFRNLYSIYGAC